MKKCYADDGAWWLLVIGGLNWGLVALGYNLVEGIFGFSPLLVQIIYLLVGVSAVFALVRKFMKKS